MGERPCARTPHFSVHFLRPKELSTAPAGERVGPVDEPGGGAGVAALLSLGMVVPKRLAKRSVTRNLVKRQMRAQVRTRLADLPAGEWVLRLRAPIDRKLYPSARSEALAEVLRAELAQLLSDALRRARSAAPAPAGAR